MGAALQGVAGCQHPHLSRRAPPRPHPAAALTSAALTRPGRRPRSHALPPPSDASSAEIPPPPPGIFQTLCRPFFRASSGRGDLRRPGRADTPHPAPLTPLLSRGTVAGTPTTSGEKGTHPHGTRPPGVTLTSAGHGRGRWPPGGRARGQGGAGGGRGGLFSGWRWRNRPAARCSVTRPGYKSTKVVACPAGGSRRQGRAGLVVRAERPA